MRKLYWWGAAGLLACAGAAYVAADHFANRHAHSWLDRYVVTGQNPAQVDAGAQAFLEMVKQGSRVVLDTVAPAPDAASKLVAQAVPEDCPEVPLCPPAPEANEPIIVAMPDLAEALRDTVSCQEGSKAAGDLRSGPVCGDAEECEDGAQTVPPCDVVTPGSPSYMPRCDEKPQADEAGKMPYVEDGQEPAEEHSFLSVWLDWLKKNSAGKKAKVEENTAQDQTDVLPVDPTAFPPGSPGTPPVPAGALEPPNCQEDPNYDQQYPGCPYTGGCPAGHCTPAAPPAEAPKKKKPKKEAKISTEQLWRVLKAVSSPEDKGLTHCGLDTMECRPSDMDGLNIDPSAPF